MNQLVKHSGNQLLASLPAEDLEALSLNLTTVSLEKGALLYDPGDEIDVVYFPHNAVVSLMTLMQSGEAIESATIGREGAVGLSSGIYPRQSQSRVIVQVAGSAARMPAAQLQQACQQSERLRFLIDRHAEALYGHAIQSVACNALHSVEARFCRWLLSCDDRIASSTVSLTQEFLADMLGVQRTTVTVVAQALQAAGLIRYRRGVVDILDRAGLEATACECYRAVRRSYQRLLPDPFPKRN